MKESTATKLEEYFSGNEWGQDSPVWRRYPYYVTQHIGDGGKWSVTMHYRTGGVSAVVGGLFDTPEAAMDYADKHRQTPCDHRAVLPEEKAQ